MRGYALGVEFCLRGILVELTWLLRHVGHYHFVRVVASCFIVKTCADSGRWVLPGAGTTLVHDQAFELHRV